MISRNTVLTEPDHDRLSALTRSRDPRAHESGWVLQQQLQCGRIVEPQAVDKNVVTMNSRVRVRDVKGRTSVTWTLVFPEEADIDEGKLSVLAPLGMAILGAKVGQTVKFQAPGGERSVKIERILYQPEAAGDYHL